MKAVHKGFHFTTYVIGENVDIKDVPAPKSSREATPRCVRLKGASQSLYLDEDSANDYGWLVVRPQMHRIGDSRITAEQLVVRDAVASFVRTALLRGSDNDHLMALENVPSGAVSGLPETPANTLLLGKASDPSYFRYEKISGAWRIAMRL
ncbi:MAG: hypothetical protein LBL45_05030, partial [Treponema sp.]|nr:hypothetical protein [Treponema sp.]